MATTNIDTLPTPEERLADLGIELPSVPVPLAAYVPAVRCGQYIHTSGQLPLRVGEMLYTGKVGEDVSSAEAKEAAAVRRERPRCRARLDR